MQNLNGIFYYKKYNIKNVYLNVSVNFSGVVRRKNIEIANFEILMLYCIL
ncbi:unnamed protein product [marine sediment metagenome]|uniref:Uncharacterized protein n=1 Tax=marine sediment metagenome TaxID=412755 RepID=X1CJG9_9ZZZZ